jgi:voltage-gated potassium channel
VALRPGRIFNKDGALKRLQLSFTLLIFTIAFGIAAYSIIEGMSPFNAFYMTIITISTVGFQEVTSLSPAGRVITIIIIITGITIGAYTIGTLFRMLIEGELRKSFGRRKVEKKISELKNHFIVCGYGRIGKLICDELETHGRSFVVVENRPEPIERLEAERVYHYPLDATEEETLVKAGIMKAAGLVTAVGADADNVFISLTARGIRPDIYILARASEPHNEVKLKRAGANKVVCPYLIGGKRMAQVLIRPTVVDFIDIAVMESHLGLQMEECMIKEGSNLVGKDLVKSNLRKDFGVIIVLIKKHDGEMIFNPQPTEVIEANDLLVVLGKKDDMDRMSKVI